MEGRCADSLVGLLARARMHTFAHVVVSPAEMLRGDRSDGRNAWVFMDEAESGGALQGPCCRPSQAAQARFPGLGKAWHPRRRQRLIKAIRELEPAATTVVGRLVCPLHPAVEGAGGSAAYGLFAAAPLRPGELVGWYGGEVMLSSEVRQDGAYTASFVVDDELEEERVHRRPACGDAEPVGMVTDGDGGWMPARPAVDIDASRVRSKVAFINDHRWDALHRRSELPPADWPMKPNVELRQVVLRLHDEELQCGVCGDQFPQLLDHSGRCDAWWPMMGVYALSDVPVGTELLLDYGEDYWRRTRQLKAIEDLVEGRPFGPSGLDSSSIPLEPPDAALWLIDHATRGRFWQDWRACRSAGRICRASVQPSLLRGAGLGLVTACAVAKGQVIFAERPLCALPDLGWVQTQAAWTRSTRRAESVATIVL